VTTTDHAPVSSSTDENGITTHIHEFDVV
jgi:hypothetical protein